MTDFDFDIRRERRGTGSMKYDCARKKQDGSDLMRLWVADMDFPSPPAVTEAISQRAEHGIFGYAQADDDYYRSVANWFDARYGYRPESNWFVITPTIVCALAMAVQAFTQPGDAVLIQQPVYHPFKNVIVQNGRTVANAPLVYENGAYRIDFEAFERVVENQKPKLFLLCNPHNPVGRVWTEDELARMCSICLDHGVIIVSDEIHADFARPGFAHCPIASLGKRVLQNCIICTSASKTFNLAGLQVSNNFVPSPELRTALKATISAAGIGSPNALGLIATQAAYDNGAEWLDQLKAYLEGNWQLISRFLEERIPQLHLIDAQSTYLAWVDCRDLGLDDAELRRLIEDEAGLWLNMGSMFGEEGSGFIRINIATQRAYLEQALLQLAEALDERLAESR